MNTRDTLRNALAFVALVIFYPAYGQSTPEVTASMRQLWQSDGTVQYIYQINNQSRQPVVAFLLGHDYEHGVSELTAYPLGWQAGGSTAALSSPSGWNSQVITTDESRYIEIEWRNQGTSDVRPGQRLDGFGVRLSGPNSIYTTANWTAILGDGTTARGKLLIDSAPRLAGTLNGAMQTSPGQWQIQLMLTNQGGAADNVHLTQIVLRTLAGTGTALIDSPAMPVNLGAFGAGETRTVALKLSVPSTVRRISITQGGTVQIGSRRAQFSGSQQLLIK